MSVYSDHGLAGARRRPKSSFLALAHPACFSLMNHHPPNALLHHDLRAPPPPSSSGTGLRPRRLLLGLLRGFSRL
jgi:hypothetical protein